MGKGVIFNIGHQKASTIEAIKKLYNPIPDVIVEKLEELCTIINNAISEVLLKKNTFF